ncbi:calcium-activated potassium channel subunit beta-3-like isoform X1 [Polypterus senegalus]|uniref:calcium-activated potassium channel subunit beta-3-like isoform X1 n=1 Tax=Polypterus senegalus TaxID=55291 RepID=UPI00196612E0|nr:calcium-activated potassium channel subunit beta-3-like isoform X1 [Polypterus senegalus]
MFLQPVSHRGSFNVPIQITMQSARRRRTRDAISSISVKEKKKENNDAKGGDKSKAQAPVSSAGEDRAILLGVGMMGFSILMYFVLGITLIKPFMMSIFSEKSNCTVMRADILEDWIECSFMCGVDCRGQAKYPCLQVFVNLSHTRRKVLLHYNDEAIQLNPKCFYIPKCLRDRNELLSEAEKIKRSLHHSNGSVFPCYYNPEKKPEDAIMFRKYDTTMVFHCLFWPTLMLIGGALIVGMVKLTQHLSQMCAEFSAAQEETQALTPSSEDSMESRPRRLDKILRWRPKQMQHAPLS